MTKPIDRAAMKAQTRKLCRQLRYPQGYDGPVYCACLFLLSLLEA